MSGWILTLRQAPALRLDLSSLQPAAVAALGEAEIARLPLWQGREQCVLGDFFSIERLTDTAVATLAPAASVGGGRPHSAAGSGTAAGTASSSAAPTTDGINDATPTLVLRGDLSRCDRIAAGLAEGSVRVEGSVGHQLAVSMTGGSVRVQGDAQEQVGVELAGGRVEVTGSIGDWAASALPGSMDGMRGGVLIVRGSVGARCADRMRRGLLLIEGDAGDFFASRLVAGTVALKGRCGPHPAHMMRRGTVVFAQDGWAPTLGPTFVPTHHNAQVAWALIARAIEAESTAFAGLSSRAMARWAGDQSVDGRGECFLAA